MDANGIISTVAGIGTTGYYFGDGGFATNAGFYAPGRLAVDAAGNLFVTDLFVNRVRKITNTRGPALALNDVSPANAGSYQLVVTGPGGSVTSSVVNLIVATAPFIYQTARNSDGSVALNFLSQLWFNQRGVGATNLYKPIAWQSLSTDLAGPDGTWQFTDTNAPGYGTRFYRSLQQGF